jgi:NNP family nitrate/nitrite transporter-like MFS transporter
MIFLAFYALCLASTWWFYLRNSGETAGAPSLAQARI